MNSSCPFYVLVAADTKEVKAAPAKPKAPAKAPAKPLPQMMEEDIIPSLKAILETPQNEISDLELFFEDNKVSYLVVFINSMHNLMQVQLTYYNAPVW